MRHPLLLPLLLFLPLLLGLVAAGQRMSLRFADGYRLRLGGLPPQIVGKGQVIASRFHPHSRWITKQRHN